MNVWSRPGDEKLRAQAGYMRRAKTVLLLGHHEPNPVDSRRGRFLPRLHFSAQP